MADDTVINRRNLRAVTFKSYGESRVLMIGTMEIWDGAELSLLRETMRRMIEQEDCRTLGIDMSYVMHVPSGFFGMLCDWHDKGVEIRLFGPLPPVKQMLWFIRFFHGVGDECYELRPSFEADFSGPDQERDPPDERGASEDSGLILDEHRTTNAPIQANGNAEFFANLPFLSQ